MGKKYVSTKTYRQIAPVAYRQWRAGTHCDQIHGYALSFHLEFVGDELDERNWMVDFGSVRTIKQLIEDLFDHKLLVAEDDPMKAELLRLGEIGVASITEVSKTGCEGIADWLYEYINTIWLKENGYVGRCWCSRVEVRETDANMAYRQGHAEDGEFE